MKRHVFIAIFFVPVCAGCSGEKSNKLSSAARSILENADYMELLSIDPGNRELDEPPPKGDYYGWKVLGKTAIEDSGTQKSIVSAVERGIVEAEGTGAACFWPRHAIHATYDGKKVDILICFECHQVLVYVDGQEKGPFLSTTSSSESVLDKGLTEANVPLAPKPPKH